MPWVYVKTQFQLVKFWIGTDCFLTPLVTKTAMTKSNYEDEEVSAQMVATTPWGAWGNVDDVAKGAVFLASDDAAWVTGVPLPVDGGYLAQ